MAIKKTKHCSWKTGELAKGCRLCVTGEKMVLFVTGKCQRSCFYCPLSDNRKDVDVIYANEWKLEDENDIDPMLKEAELTDARGAGITGGDPLEKIDRTVKFIKILKEKFGKNFHIHLYTIMQSVNKKNLDKLYDAGLDEIRFHPDFHIKKDWGRIDLVKSYDWEVGVEIPVIPGLLDKTRELIGFFAPKIDFLNLNELEISDNNSQQLLQMKYVPKDDLSYGIKGSDEMAKELMEEFGDKINIHYCTTKLKDSVQLANRLKRRAKNIAKKFDMITEEGLLIRGVLYLTELVPSFGYERVLAELKNRDELVEKLKDIRQELLKEYRLHPQMIFLDERKVRLLTSPKLARKIKHDSLKNAVVSEYPTWDQLEIEIDFVD